jgi:hypothetical protein
VSLGFGNTVDAQVTWWGSDYGRVETLARARQGNTGEGV